MIMADFQEHISALGEELRSSFGDIWMMAGPEFSKPAVEIDEGTLYPAGSFDQSNPYALGAKRSFVPILGEIVWELPRSIASGMAFHAYIFRVDDGRRLGYVRLPHYFLNQRALNDFAGLMERFEQTTTAIVLDQVNNPGGDMFHMYSILSNLTDKPLELPKHQIAIWDELAAAAAELVRSADSDEPQQPGLHAFPELIDYYRFILEERNAGRDLTNPVYIGGIAEILPAKKHYSKKIVVLINALDFSAAEFLAAILQDNDRAVLFGERTAGAGGCARITTDPTLCSSGLGVESISITWTMAWRTNGHPIEDLGVHPDIKYDMTVDDLQSGYNGYRKSILESVCAD